MMEFVKLTNEQRECFDENGYLVVTQAIDQETVEALTEIADEFMESELYREHGEPVAKNHYYSRYFDLTQHEVSRKLITNPLTLSPVVQLLSPEIRLTPRFQRLKKSQRRSRLSMMTVTLPEARPPIRLRFILNRAELYSFHIGDMHSAFSSGIS